MYRMCVMIMYMYLHGIVFTIASQMWLLGRLLPLMIGQYVPNDDPHWVCFLELLSLLVLSTAVEVTSDSITDLKMIVESYLVHYNELYPNSMTPKMQLSTPST